MSEAVCDSERLLTLGQIAKQLDVPTHRVKYAIDMAKIEPLMRVGILRVWPSNVIDRVKTELERISANHGGN